jgi:site-specific recombinase XerD
LATNRRDLASVGEGTEPGCAVRSSCFVFLNHYGRPLTRFGIRYILAWWLHSASEDTRVETGADLQVSAIEPKSGLVPNLRKKRLHPHSMRHRTAIALLMSGNDLSTISRYLGHAGLASLATTTNRYLKVIGR